MKTGQTDKLKRDKDKRRHWTHSPSNLYYFSSAYIAPSLKVPMKIPKTWTYCTSHPHQLGHCLWNPLCRIPEEVKNTAAQGKTQYQLHKMHHEEEMKAFMALVAPYVWLVTTLFNQWRRTLVFGTSPVTLNEACQSNRKPIKGQCCTTIRFF